MELDSLVVVKPFEELWDELNMHLQKGIPDVQTLQRVYNALMKVMSKGIVVLGHLPKDADIGQADPEKYTKLTRGMILQNMHFNEREILRRLYLSKAKKEIVVYRDLLIQRMGFCKDIQRLLRDKLETFKLDFQLSGGNYEI